MLQRVVAYGPVGPQPYCLGHVYPHEKGEQESGGVLRQIQPGRPMAVALALDESHGRDSRDAVLHPVLPFSRPSTARSLSHTRALESTALGRACCHVGQG